MKEMKRLLAIILAVVMLVGIVPVSAFAAEGDPVVVIAGSDYQQSGSTTPKNNATSILNRIEQDYAKESGVVKGFLFGGDYSQSINSSSTTTSGINELKGVVQGVYGTGLNEVYVQGNHDAAVSGLTATGAHDTDYYGVFSINEDDFPSGGSVSSTMLTNLQNYLNGKVNEGYKKPIFVVTHLPLHKTTRYDSTGTGASIFNVLNEAGGKGLNIIFLFGHNHSQGYDAYLGNGSIYLPKGDKITVDGGSTETILNFTYANYGYVGYVSGSSCTHLTMTAFEIYEDEVIVKRYDSNGLHTCGTTANVLKAAGGGTVPSGAKVNGTVYTSPKSITLTTPTGGSGDDNTDPDTPDTPDTPVTGNGNVWRQATAITAGKRYMLVNYGSNTSGVGTYAVNSTAGATAVTVQTDSTGAYIVNNDMALAWIAEVGSSYNFLKNASTGNYLNSSNYGESSGTALSVASATSTYSDWFINSGILSVSNKGGSRRSYPVAYSGSAFAAYGNGETPNNGVVVFEETSETGSGGGTTPDTPVTPPTVDTENKGWVTISDGKGKAIYELDKDGVNAGQNYLIVNTGTDGDAFALTNNGGSVDKTAVTISGSKIVVDDTNLAWTFTSSSDSYVINNGETYIHPTRDGGLLGDSENVTVSANGNNTGRYNLTRKSSWGNTTYYVTYSGDVFTTVESRSSNNGVYLFRKTGTETTTAEYAKLDGELTYTVARGADRDTALAAVMAGIDVITSTDKTAETVLDDANTDIKWDLASNYDGSVPGEYAVTIKYDGKPIGTVKVIVPNVGVEAEDILYFIDETKTASINATLVEGTPDNGAYAFEVVEGGDAIIESIDADGKITFTGTEGTAQVKITYTYTEGETTSTLEKTITVTAKKPYYTVEICNPVTADGTTTYEPITAPIALKGVEAGDEYSLWAVIKEFNAAYPEGNDLGDVDDNLLRWTVSNTSIAEIDPATGVLAFTGTNYGTFEVTVRYLDENGEPPCEDTITISATESL